jgi:VanZ family protein
MFFPLGLLLSAMWGTRLSWIAPVVGMAASTGAELAQMLLLPNRVASPEDVVANTAGAVLGTVVILIVRSVMLSRTQRVTTRAVIAVHAFELNPTAA